MSQQSMAQMLMLFLFFMTSIHGQLDPLDPDPPEPTVCEISMVNLQVSRFDLAQDIFVYSGWINSVCMGDVNDTIDELTDMTKTEGDDGQQTMNVERRTFTKDGQVYTWSTMRVWHKFHHPFNLYSYPFTTNYITVSIECNLERALMQWILGPDSVSNHESSFFVDKAFQYAGVRAYIDEVAYPSRFGLPPGATNDSFIYDRLNIEFTLSQNDIVNFMQNMIATYVAMLMALISLMIPVSGGLDARLGLLGAGLFVCVLNIATFNQYLGFQPYLTTGDILNMLTMSFIGIIVVITVWEKLMLMRGKSSDVRNCLCGCGKDPKPMPPTTQLNGISVADVVASDAPDATLKRKNRALDIAFAPGLTTEGDFVQNPDDLRIPFYTSVPFWAFAILLASYLAANIGLLVGYRA